MNMGRRVKDNFTHLFPQLVVAIWGSWGYFCMGSVRGRSSPGIPSHNSTMDFDMSPSDLQWISSFPMLGAILGSLFINKPMEYYGRKKALVGHYIVFICGFFISGFTHFGEHKSMLYIGRFLMGIAAGCTTPAAQIYVSECASPSLRGWMGSLTASSLVLGVWSTYIVGIFVEWHVLAWIFGCLPILFLCGTVMMPESPVWLLSHGREQEARRSLQSLRGKGANVQTELERIKKHLERVANYNSKSLQVTSGSVVKPLFISLSIMLFQQTTGINAIVFYTASIFQAAGSSINGKYATIIVGAVQLIFTIASGFLADRCGRRMLYLVSAVSSAVPLAALGIFFCCQRRWGDQEAIRYFGWLPFASLIVFFITYSGGISNVPFIIMGEMFPLRYRTLLGGISSSFHLFCTFVMVRFFPDMLRAMGKDGTFYFFCGCTLLSAIFVYFLLPETKGKTLEELEQLFRSNNIEPHKRQYYLEDTLATEKNTNWEVVLLRRSETKDSHRSELQLCVNKLEVTLEFYESSAQFNFSTIDVV
ncbi:facilitated trehalose transporter Tret1-like [Daphnia carinata]|uniref:facilitated trehalose transporter Tret1-like n=1 Tax=Daphnia carinata TaxID=120202 RepID=UPI00257FCBF2|nr:facilitated trehalose transporter Tret1-like [Daphnia carinata]